MFRVSRLSAVRNTGPVAVVALAVLLAMPLAAHAQHVAGPRSVSVTTPIIVPSGPGPASPYPLVIPVSGVQGRVGVSVRLTGLTHTWPTDLDILLVYPTGERVMLMSDVDAGPVSGVDLTFENGAPLPPTTLVTGTYSPSDRFPGDSLPSPAPAAPYLSYLPSVGSGNGNWLLYVADDAGGDAGSIASVQLLFTHFGSSPQTVVVDNGTVEFPFVFGGVTGAVALLTPTFSFSHPAVGELDIYLVAPDGTTVELSTGNGGLGATTTQRFCSTVVTFSDAAATSIVGAAPPYAGPYRPEQPLWPLAGTPANGTWKIRVVDRSPGNVGTFDCVSLSLAGDGPTSMSDAFATAFNAPLSIAAPGVLANDNPNLGGGPLTAALVGPAAHGTVSLAANGGFHYTPAIGFVGVDTFTYRSLSPRGTGTTATVSVTVQQPTTVQPPSGLHAWSIDGHEVTLRWMPPQVGPAPTAYVLEGGVQPGEVLASIPTGSGVPAFRFTAPTGSFHVRIRSVGGGIISAPSADLPIHVMTPVPPSAPAGLAAVVNGSTLGLSWRPTFAGGAPSSFVLHVSGTVNAALPLGPSIGASFAGVPPGNYTLSLQSTNASGVSPMSNPVAMVVPGPCTGAPQPPEGFLVFKTGSVLTVVWDAAATGPATTGFVLNVSGAFVGSVPLSGRSTSAPVGPGTYVMSLFATNSCGASAPTASQSITVP